MEFYCLTCGGFKHKEFDKEVDSSISDKSHDFVVVGDKDSRNEFSKHLHVFHTDKNESIQSFKRNISGHEVVYNSINYPTDIQESITTYLQRIGKFDEYMEKFRNINTIIFYLRFVTDHSLNSQNVIMSCEHHYTQGYCYSCKCEFCLCSGVEHFKHTYILYFEHPKLLNVEDVQIRLQNLESNKRIIEEFRKFNYNNVYENLKKFKREIYQFVASRIPKLENFTIQKYLVKSLMSLAFNTKITTKQAVDFYHAEIGKLRRENEKIQKEITFTDFPTKFSDNHSKTFRKYIEVCKRPDQPHDPSQPPKYTRIIVNGYRFGENPYAIVDEKLEVYNENPRRRDHYIHINHNDLVLTRRLPDLVLKIYEHEFYIKIDRDSRLGCFHVHSGSDERISTSANKTRSCNGQVRILSQKYTFTHSVYFIDERDMFIIYTPLDTNQKPIQMIYGDHVQNSRAAKDVSFNFPFDPNDYSIVNLLNTNIEIMIKTKGECFYMTRTETPELITLTWNKLDIPFIMNAETFIGAEDNDDLSYGCIFDGSDLHFKNRPSIHVNFALKENRKVYFDYTPYNIHILEVYDNDSSEIPYQLPYPVTYTSYSTINTRFTNEWLVEYD